MTLVESAPPAVLTEVDAWNVRDVEDVARVRGLLQEALDTAEHAKQPVDDQARDRIVLVASELATNGVRHGRQPVTLRLLRHGSTVAVDVVDHRPDAPPVVRDGGGAGGFGLILAERTAAAIGWFRLHGAKHVWAQFA